MREEAQKGKREGEVKRRKTGVEEESGRQKEGK